MYTASTPVASATEAHAAAVAELQAVREKAIAAKKRLDAELINEHLDHWGVTAEQYAAAKARARADNLPLSKCLNDVRIAAGREARKAQTGVAQPLGQGVKATGVRRILGATID